MKKLIELAAAAFAEPAPPKNIEYRYIYEPVTGGYAGINCH